MALEGRGRDFESLGCPREREGGRVEHFFRHRLFVEVSLADDEEMAGGVVACCGISHELGRSQLEDVALLVDSDVIGDVDPPVRILVEELVLAEASGPLLPPRATAVWWIVMLVMGRLGSPPARAGWARHAARHNISPE